MKTLSPVGNNSAEFEAGVESVRSIRCLNHMRIGPYNAAECTGAECAACAVETELAAMTAQRDDLLRTMRLIARGGELGTIYSARALDTIARVERGSA